MFGSYNFDYDFEENVIYCYGKRACDTPDIGQVWIENGLAPRNPEMYNRKGFKFNLKYSGGAKVYGNETFEADVCPLGIRVIKEGKIMINEVVLNYRNGEVLELIDEY